MQSISIPIAFGAGIISFFAPCVLPLIPVYVGYMTGLSAKELSINNIKKTQTIVKAGLLYILGFSLIFVVLGSTFGGVGTIFRSYEKYLQIIGGLIILVFGIDLAGYIKLPLFFKTGQYSMPKWTYKLGFARPFLIGIVFATAWTPCIGAILGSILALAAVSATASHGALLLFVYSLGISLPFLLVSLFFGISTRHLMHFKKYSYQITKLSGWMLIILGTLLITNLYRYLNAWIFEVAFKLGYTVK